MVEIEWTGRAINDLEKLDKPVARRVVRKLDWFSNNFERTVPEPLGGQLKGAFKLRVGDWRVIYTVEDNVIVVQFIGHRREIYKIR
ncbi:MAG: type II toxin-antitoxin system RelE family toxin [Chloroflexota bacterium]